MEPLKLSVIKDYDKLDDEQKEQVRLYYPMGFNNALLEFTNSKRKKIIAIRYETAEIIFMLRLSKQMVNQIIEEENIRYDLY
jgi:hypothetical protein